MRAIVLTMVGTWDPHTEEVTRTSPQPLLVTDVLYAVQATGDTRELNPDAVSVVGFQAGGRHALVTETVEQVANLLDARTMRGSKREGT